MVVDGGMSKWSCLWLQGRFVPIIGWMDGCVVGLVCIDQLHAPENHLRRPSDLHESRRLIELLRYIQTSWAHIGVHPRHHPLVGLLSCHILRSRVFRPSRDLASIPRHGTDRKTLTCLAPFDHGMVMSLLQCLSLSGGATRV
jgi:hypothetical protein